MAVKYLVKRGTQAQILSGTLEIGELAFATDSKHVITYDGVAKQLVGRANMDTFANRPAAGVQGRFFFASDTKVIYFDNGATWDTVAPGDNIVTLAHMEHGTQGDLLYYGASGAPTRLSAGAAGQILTSGGASANPAWDTAMDVVGGRLNALSATSLGWVFWKNNQIRIYNGLSWELIRVTTEPTVANTSNDLNGTALAVNKIYDVFAEYSNSTSFNLKFSRWASFGAGTSSRTAAYSSGTTYNIGDRVTYGGHDYVCIQSGSNKTPSSEATYWDDNGTSIAGDFSGLYRHDGVLVSSNSTNGRKRRWLGVIYTHSNGGTVNFKDEEIYRYVGNYYNRHQKAVKTYNTTANWTYGTLTWREANGGSGNVRGQMVSATTDTVAVGFFELMLLSGAIMSCSGMHVNAVNDYSTRAFVPQMAGYQVGGNTGVAIVKAGYNFISLVEVSNPTTTFHSDSGHDGHAYVNAWTC